MAKTISNISGFLCFSSPGALSRSWLIWNPSHRFFDSLQNDKRPIEPKKEGSYHSARFFASISMLIATGWLIPEIVSIAEANIRLNSRRSDRIGRS